MSEEIDPPSEENAARTDVLHLFEIVVESLERGKVFLPFVIAAFGQRGTAGEWPRIIPYSDRIFFLTRVSLSNILSY